MTMEVVGVGIATIDVIQEVDTYPEEDTKIRALSSRKTRGGNVTNALVISAQLGCRCHWLGTTTDPNCDGDAAFVAADLASFGVDASAADIVATGSMPVSYILASKANGSRTIIHHRDLPELTLDAFRRGYESITTTTKGSGQAAVWVHFEGRNLDNVEQMLKYLRERDDGAKISIEVEALRNDWDQIQRMLLLVDVVFVSKDYIAKKLGFPDASTFFQYFEEQIGTDRRPKFIICPWGSHGVYCMNTVTFTKHHVPTTPLDQPVDSVGAGDSFIGAALAALAQNAPFHEAMHNACRVATAKCAQEGFHLPEELKLSIRSRLHQ